MKLVIRGDGTPTDTKVLGIDKDGVEHEVFGVKSLKISIDAEYAHPMVTMELSDVDFDMNLSGVEISLRSKTPSVAQKDKG